MASPYLPVTSSKASPYQHLPVTSSSYQPMNGQQGTTSSPYQPMNGSLGVTSSVSSSYHPPPLPPRVGPRRSDGGNAGNVVSVYKPVPPPKPFSGPAVTNNSSSSSGGGGGGGGGGSAGENQQDSRRQEQQETAASLREQLASVTGTTLQSGLPPLLPHILVTDQGHFHTHSTKFPIESKEEPPSFPTTSPSWRSTIRPPPPLLSGSSSLGRGIKGLSGLAGMGVAKGSTLPRSITTPTPAQTRPQHHHHSQVTNGGGGGGGGSGSGGGGGGGGERDHLLSTERHIRFCDGIDNPGLVEDAAHMSYRAAAGGGGGGGGGGAGAARPPSGIPPEGTLAGTLPSHPQQRPFESPFLSRPFRNSSHQQYHPPTSQPLPVTSQHPQLASHGLVSSQYPSPGPQHLPPSSQHAPVPASQAGAFNREAWARSSQGHLTDVVELHPPQGHLHLNGHTPSHHHAPTSPPSFPHNGVAHPHHAHPHAHPIPNNHVEGAHTHPPVPQHQHNGEATPEESSERREEARKDDKWGSLTRGLAARKYQNFKEKLTNKFSRSDKPEERPGQQGEVRGAATAQGTTTQEAPPVASRQEGGGQASVALDGGRAAKLNTSFRKALHQSSGKDAATAETMLNGHQEHGGGGQQGSGGGGGGGGLPPHYPRPAAGRPPAALPPQSSPPLGRPADHMGRGLANRRSGSYHHLTHLRQEAPAWRPHHYSADNLADDHALPSDHTYSGPAAGAGRGQPAGGEGGCGGSGGSDSGRGTAGSGGESRPANALDTSLDSAASQRHAGQGHSSGNDSEWVDVTDAELQRIMKLGAEGKGGGGGGGGVAGRESLAATPPLPPLSPEATPQSSPSRHRKHGLSYSCNGLNKPDLLEAAGRRRGGAGHDSSQSTPRREGGTQGTHGHSSGKGNSGSGSGGHKSAAPPGSGWAHRKDEVRQRSASFDSHRHKNRINLDPSAGDLEAGEITSTTDALDLDSMLDGATEATTDDEALSAYDPDVHLIRKQLEGLEGMYSEVLKLLGGRRGGRTVLGGGDLKNSRRRLHGSLSSLPSSVMSSRPGKDRRKVIDDRVRRTARDNNSSKNIHKRFQRLESHVVTLARSVAHLSSEMRTQHLMFQEIESIRAEIAGLRSGGGGGGGGMSNGGAGSPARVGGHVSWESFRAGIPGLSNPGRVKKLTQFFGDEPPLVRIFLRKLGYEKYAALFEQEKIGMLELPYLTEERLHKIGIPMGPRLRILQEAQGPIRKEGNLSVYVV
ncbi:hornerin-like isoform X2 [Scylla paramamosain]|uniref:hornerin-like isoform X2 n=1 Tax=Scylla paramamosain TaxID=85552 RepID=UPI003082A73A